MNWVSENLVETLLIVGLVLLAVEILVLGFSTFVLFFVGLATVITAGLTFLGVVPETALNALLSIGILTAVSAALLWKPMKKMQMDVESAPVKNDLVGMSFILPEDVSIEHPSTYRYSGIDWKLVSRQALTAGTEVTVVKTDVGVFEVEPKS